MAWLIRSDETSMPAAAPASMCALLRNVLRDAVARIAGPVSDAIVGLVAVEFEMHVALTDGPDPSARSHRARRCAKDIAPSSQTPEAGGSRR